METILMFIKLIIYNYLIKPWLDNMLCILRTGLLCDCE